MLSRKIFGPKMVHVNRNLEWRSSKPLINPLKEFKLKTTSGPFFSLLNDLSSRVESNRLRSLLYAPNSRFISLYHVVFIRKYFNLSQHSQSYSGASPSSVLSISLKTARSKFLFYSGRKISVSIFVQKA